MVRPAPAARIVANIAARFRFMARDHSMDFGGLEAGSMNSLRVPHSSGTAAPKLKLPPDSCYCHMHIYDGVRFPPLRPGGRMQPTAAVGNSQFLQQRPGTSRTVVVQPAAYLTDNNV